MYKSLFVALSLLALTNAMPQYGGGYSSGHGESHYESPAVYQFKYSVHDEHTGDIKSQEEVADGHSIKGTYSLKEPYGGQRVVKYSDDGHGFVAHVETSKIAHPTSHGSSHGYSHGSSGYGASHGSSGYGASQGSSGYGASQGSYGHGGSY